MTALLTAIAVFAFFWAIGLAFLAVVRADVQQLRVVLTAPVLGSAIAVLPLFVLSFAGLPMDPAAWPVVIALGAASVAILAVRRPRVPRAVLPVMLACLVSLVLLGRPMLEFGFHWVGNANADMAAYTLSATQLMHHGLRGAVDSAAIANNHSFSTITQAAHTGGARPGADIVIAAFATVSGRWPADIYMPFILALNLGTLCAAGALAMQAARKRWAAGVAAGLLAVAPFAVFGVLQQLLPQTWGLGLAAGLFAWLMRPEVHGRPGPDRVDLAAIGILVPAFVLVYSELAAAMLLAYGLYVAILVMQRRVQPRALLLLWGTVAVAVLLIHNVYLLNELQYVRGQAANGVASGGGTTGSGAVPLFGYTLVPAALAGLFGFQLLPSSPTAQLLGASIVASIALIAVLLAYSVLTARRGVAASAVLLADFGFALMLALHRSDFGLYKMFMYVQPFVAVAVAVWLSSIRRRPVLAVAGIFLTLVVGLQLRNVNIYVQNSRNPIDLKHGSSPDLFPYFRRVFANADVPVITVTDNPTVGTLQAATAGKRPLYFISRTFFSEQRFWKLRAFDLLRPGERKVNSFRLNAPASALLQGGRCVVVLPTGTQSVLNRVTMPEGSRDLVTQRCGRPAPNTLVFISSALGQGFYLPQDRKFVTSYQLERDPQYPERTLSGFGRYALFRVLNPSASVRLVLDVTTTLRQDAVNEIPRASVIGTTRVRLPIVGRGSARVVSPPVKPQVIEGAPYLLLDMGVDGKLIKYHRSGIAGLYGRDVPLDGRFLTSWVRGISLISDADYRRMRPPSDLRQSRAALANRSLQYSGIYEDGWLSEHSYVRLAAGPATNLVLRAEVLPIRGRAQHLEVSVDGRTVVSRGIVPGTVETGVPVSRSASPRLVELRFAHVRHLAGIDRRPASAQLQYLGLAGQLKPITRFPADLQTPGVEYSGIYKDGWVTKDAYALLAGGEASTLLVQATVPVPKGQHVAVLVNGRPMVSQSAASGALELRVRLPPSSTKRRIEFRFAHVVGLTAPDPRRVAARLLTLRLLRPHTPTTVTVPDLARPGLAYAGIYPDGWLEKKSSVVLSGGAAASLVLNANVPAIKAQHLDVLVNGRRIASRDVAPGRIELRASLPPSRPPRRIELHWRASMPLMAPDTRRASALLEGIRVVARRAGPRSVTSARRSLATAYRPSVRPSLTAADRPSATMQPKPAPPAGASPAAVQLPAGLSDSGLRYTGIYTDGWTRKDATLVLTGGAARNLVLRGSVPENGPRRVTVAVNGRKVGSVGVRPGALTILLPLPASASGRRIELHWAREIVLKAPDNRRAAALLSFVGLVRSPSAVTIPKGLSDPALRLTGVYRDGWARKNSSLVLVGGPAASLVVRAAVPAQRVQRLTVVVNGRKVASKAVAPGHVTLRLSLPASASDRRIELNWAREIRLKAPDRRPAAAQLVFVGLVPPPSIVHFPAGLNEPGLQYTGIFPDGWVSKNASIVLAGGAATELVLQGEVPKQAGQRLTIVVNGNAVISTAVTAGPLDVRVRIAPSKVSRRIELRWARTIALRPPDARRAAAQLTLVELAAPPSLVHAPADLGDPGLESAGIFKDGWVSKEASILLAGGAAANLLVRMEVPLQKGQHLAVTVNGRQLSATNIKPGSLSLRIAVPASSSARRIRLRWASDIALKAPDTRRAAARLVLIGLVPAPSAVRIPEGLANAALQQTGIYTDGWVGSESSLLLAGGPATSLVVQAEVPQQAGQHLTITVNGRQVSSTDVKPGKLDVRVALPASGSGRRVRLRWAHTISLKAPDKRQAAARLQYVGLGAPR